MFQKSRCKFSSINILVNLWNEFVSPLSDKQLRPENLTRRFP